MKCLFVGNVCLAEANAHLFEKGDIHTLFGDTVSLSAALRTLTATNCNLVP